MRPPVDVNEVCDQTAIEACANNSDVPQNNKQNHGNGGKKPPKVSVKNSCMKK